MLEISCQLATSHFVLPAEMHTLHPLLRGHFSRICSGTGLMYLSPNKYMKPALEQILLECPLRSRGLCVCVRQDKSGCQLATNF